MLTASWKQSLVIMGNKMLGSRVTHRCQEGGECQRQILLPLTIMHWTVLILSRNCLHWLPGLSEPWPSFGISKLLFPFGPELYLGCIPGRGIRGYREKTASALASKVTLVLPVLWHSYLWLTVLLRSRHMLSSVVATSQMNNTALLMRRPG